MSNSKVFVTQFSPRLQFSQAEEYGEVKFLTSSEYRPEPCPEAYNRAISSEIMRNLSDYIAGVDYIMLTGSAIPNVIVGGALGSINGPHKVLKWSNRTSTYELFII